jgi:hypothetical protein
MAKLAREAAFDREFRGHIERFTKPLVTALRKIVRTEPPSEVEALLFVIEAEWREFPVYALAMDEDLSDEVYFDPPFDGRLLPKAGELIPKGEIDQDAYEAAGVPTFERGAGILAEWFGECWHAAGGAKFPIPAYIYLHDSSCYFDLRNRQWVWASDM